MECVEKIIKKDMIHPLTGQTLKEKDIITLQRGGTGYSATNDQLKATKYRPSSLLAWIVVLDKNSTILELEDSNFEFQTINHCMYYGPI